MSKFQILFRGAKKDKDDFSTLLQQHGIPRSKHHHRFDDKSAEHILVVNQVEKATISGMADDLFRFYEQRKRPDISLKPQTPPYDPQTARSFEQYMRVGRHVYDTTFTLEGMKLADLERFIEDFKNLVYVHESKIREGIEFCLANVIELVEATDELVKTNRTRQGFILLSLALEELGKAIHVMRAAQEAERTEKDVVTIDSFRLHEVKILEVFRKFFGEPKRQKGAPVWTHEGGILESLGRRAFRNPTLQELYTRITLNLTEIESCMENALAVCRQYCEYTGYSGSSKNGQWIPAHLPHHLKNDHVTLVSTITKKVAQTYISKLQSNKTFDELLSFDDLIRG